MIKKILVSTAIFIVIAAATSAAAKPARYHLLMDKGWKFYLGNEQDASAASFNDARWRNLNLPHDWSIEWQFNKSEPTGGGGGYLPTGIGWYRKTFRLPAAAARKLVQIQFDGVYMNSEVWING